MKIKKRIIPICDRLLINLIRITIIEEFPSALVLSQRVWLHTEPQKEFMARKKERKEEKTHHCQEKESIFLKRN